MKLALLSDIHEDRINLAKALKMIEKLRCDEIACLGDIVGFSTPFYKYHETRDANECIRLISENARYVIAGNHDHYALRKLPEFVPGFELPQNWYDLPFDKRKKIAGGLLWLYEDNELSALLCETSAEWLAQLPEQIILKAGEYNILLTHFLAPDISGITTKFLLDTADFEGHLNMMNIHNANLAIFGHTHQAGLLVVRRGNGKPEIQKKIRPVKSICGAGIPAVATSTGYSGFAVFDTDNGALETYSLKSTFHVLQG